MGPREGPGKRKGDDILDRRDHSDTNLDEGKDSLRVAFCCFEAKATTCPPPMPISSPYSSSPSLSLSPPTASGPSLTKGPFPPTPHTADACSPLSSHSLPSPSHSLPSPSYSLPSPSHSLSSPSHLPLSSLLLESV